MKGLIIKSPWIDLIFNGQKIWEIRGSNTYIRGTIALIKSGTGKIYGTVDLIDSFPLNINDDNEDKHCIHNIKDIKYGHPYVWALANPIKFDKPIPYRHPQGAVIWVNVDI